MQSTRLLLLFLLITQVGLAAEPKPVPRMQVLPLPHDEVSFQRDGQELARFHYGMDQRRPFVHPINGPSGRSLTRMGHPRDPDGHSHHNSVWFSHESVGGVNFWSDRGGRIEHRRVLRFEDSEELAYVETENAWLNPDGKPVLTDRRRVGARFLLVRPAAPLTQRRLLRSGQRKCVRNQFTVSGQEFANDHHFLITLDNDASSRCWVMSVQPG